MFLTYFSPKQICNHDDIEKSKTAVREQPGSPAFWETGDDKQCPAEAVPSSETIRVCRGLQEEQQKLAAGPLRVNLGARGGSVPPRRKLWKASDQAARV